MVCSYDNISDTLKARHCVLTAPLPPSQSADAPHHREHLKTNTLCASLRALSLFSHIMFNSQSGRCQLMNVWPAKTQICYKVETPRNAVSHLSLFHQHYSPSKSSKILDETRDLEHTVIELQRQGILAGSWHLCKPWRFNHIHVRGNFFCLVKLLH